MTLEQALQKAQQQGATHYYMFSADFARVYRYIGKRWQGKSIDGDTRGWTFYGTWRDLPGDLPQPAQYITNSVEGGH